jgi:hypothetical protein
MAAGSIARLSETLDLTGIWVKELRLAAFFGACRSPFTAWAQYGQMKLVVEASFSSGDSCAGGMRGSCCKGGLGCQDSEALATMHAEPSLLHLP